jgi:hypothetical protein
MKMKWSHWLIIIGLGVELIDGLTTPAGSSGGIFFGSTGFLNKQVGSVSLASVPVLHMDVAEAAAIVGAAFLFMHHKL